MKSRFWFLVIFITFLVYDYSAIASSFPDFSVDASSDEIVIDDEFKGIGFFMFGIKRPDDEVALLIRGPKKDYSVSRRLKVFGLWIGSDVEKIFDARSFYYFSSTRASTDLNGNAVTLLFNLGLRLDLSSGRDLFSSHDSLFLNAMKERGLYVFNDGDTVVTEGRLFKGATILPHNLSIGSYAGLAILFRDDFPREIIITPINVKQSGINAFVVRSIENHPLLYGLSVVFTSIALGIINYVFFRKQ